MVLFCPDLTCKEEVKAMVIGTWDFTRPVLHACLKSKCVAYKDGRCVKYDNEVEKGGVISGKVQKETSGNRGVPS